MNPCLCINLNVKKFCLLDMRDPHNSSSYKKMDRISTGDHFHHNSLSFFFYQCKWQKSLPVRDFLCIVPSQPDGSHTAALHMQAGGCLHESARLLVAWLRSFICPLWAPCTKDGERIHRWKSGVCINKLDSRSAFKRKDKKAKRLNGRKPGEWRVRTASLFNTPCFGSEW